MDGTFSVIHLSRYKWNTNHWCLLILRYMISKLWWIEWDSWYQLIYVDNNKIKQRREIYTIVDHSPSRR